LAAAAPHRADGVDDVLGFEAIAAGDLGGTGVAAAERAAFGEKLRPGGAMDGPVDAAAAEQWPGGSVDDGPDIERGDVRGADFEPRRADFGGEEGSGHGSMVAQSHARCSAVRVAARSALLDHFRLDFGGKIDGAAAADVGEMGIEEAPGRALPELVQRLEIFVVGLERAARAEGFAQVLHDDAMELEPAEFTRP